MSALASFLLVLTVTSYFRRQDAAGPGARSRALGAPSSEGPLWGALPHPDGRVAMTLEPYPWRELANCSQQLPLFSSSRSTVAQRRRLPRAPPRAACASSASPSGLHLLYSADERDWASLAASVASAMANAREPARLRVHAVVPLGADEGALCDLAARAVGLPAVVEPPSEQARRDRELRAEAWSGMACDAAEAEAAQVAGRGAVGEKEGMEGGGVGGAGGAEGTEGGGVGGAGGAEGTEGSGVGGARGAEGTEGSGVGGERAETATQAAEADARGTRGAGDGAGVGDAAAASRGRSLRASRAETPRRRALLSNGTSTGVSSSSSFSSSSSSSSFAPFASSFVPSSTPRRCEAPRNASSPASSASPLPCGCPGFPQLRLIPFSVDPSSALAEAMALARGGHRNERKSLRTPLNFARNEAAAYLDPREVGRFMYLDADTIVQEDAAAALDVPLAPGHAVRWSRSCRIRASRLFETNAPEVRAAGVRPRDCYVNAGAFVADLAEWTRRDVSARVANLTRLHAKRRLWREGVQQPSFVLALHDASEDADERWNLGALGFNPAKERVPLCQVRSGAVLHWNGAYKPWACRKGGEDDAQGTADGDSGRDEKGNSDDGGGGGGGGGGSTGAGGGGGGGGGSTGAGDDPLGRRGGAGRSDGIAVGERRRAAGEVGSGGGAGEAGSGSKAAGKGEDAVPKATAAAGSDQALDAGGIQGELASAEGARDGADGDRAAAAASRSRSATASALPLRKTLAAGRELKRRPAKGKRKGKGAKTKKGASKKDYDAGMVDGSDDPCYASYWTPYAPPL